MTDATLPQEIQVLTLISKEADPKGFAQNLISNWGAVKPIGQGEIDQATFLEAIKAVVNPFAEEKTELRFFLDGWKPSTVEDQLEVLQSIYSKPALVDLDRSQVVEIASRIAVPEEADGLFVVPKPSVIAARFEIQNPYGEGYGKLLESTVLAHLAYQRKFHNYRAGELTADRVRMRQSAAEALRKLEAVTPGDFLVFPAQTGLKWGGYSPQNACWEIEHKCEGEFPLPAWVVGHILLTNPTRLEKFEQLCIDCPGDEYRFRPDEGFGHCLYFSFDDGRLGFNGGWIGYVFDNFGSASGFLR